MICQRPVAPPRQLGPGAGPEKDKTRKAAGKPVAEGAGLADHEAGVADTAESVGGKRGGKKEKP